MNLGRLSTRGTALLLLAVVAIFNVSTAWADHRHGGVRYGVGVVVAPRWDPWFWGPPYPYPYPAYPPVIIERSPSLSPALRAISASTALHEAIEALRWARELKVV